MAYQIKVFRDRCIMSGVCVDEAPNTFATDDEGLVILKNANGDNDETVLAAAEACPVECIALEDNSGTQVWPEP